LPCPLGNLNININIDIDIDIDIDSKGLIDTVVFSIQQAIICSIRELEPAYGCRCIRD